MGGSYADLERACPQLYQQRENGTWQEAYLDVVAKFPGSNHQYMIDVTIRAPFAPSYGNTHLRPGLPSAAGEKTKADRYGPSVSPLAFESCGRLGTASCKTLVSLAEE